MKDNIIANKTFEFSLSVINLYMQLKEKMNSLFRNNCYDVQQVLELM